MEWVTIVGSRKAPLHVLRQMCNLACELSTELGYGVRTGDATGSDEAAREGALPERLDVVKAGENTPDSDKIALDVLVAHHGPSIVSRVKKYMFLHGRNPIQVLGRDLNTPSKAVVCWTPNDKPVGGTRTAIWVAENYNIQVFNLFYVSTRSIIKYLEEN